MFLLSTNNFQCLVFMLEFVILFSFFFASSSIKTIIFMNNNLVLLEIYTTIDKTLKKLYTKIYLQLKRYIKSILH